MGRKNNIKNECSKLGTVAEELRDISDNLAKTGNNVIADLLASKASIIDESTSFMLKALHKRNTTKTSWASSEGKDEYGRWADFEYKGIRQRLRLIKPGTFMMGSPEDEPERWDDEKQHEVTISTPYWVFDTAVTQELWEAAIGSNPSHFK